MLVVRGFRQNGWMRRRQRAMISNKEEEDEEYEWNWMRMHRSEKNMLTMKFCHMYEEIILLKYKWIVFVGISYQGMSMPL